MRMVATFRRISMYALAHYVPGRNQETFTATKVDNTGRGGRVTSHPHIDLSAVSLAYRTPEQDQRRIQGQPSTGINPCREPNETTPGEPRCPNPEPSPQHVPIVARNSAGRVR